ncbi:SNF2 family N-terminal domain-containing protein [Phlyctochytrium arcticum]|nr:SNF2 family N-terminal domain-containing protein [Phlyctochytrium arcticum]
MLKMENGTNAGGILADDMGLGKTIQSIATILSNRGADPRPTLIIAPVSLLFQWQQELSEKAPNAVKILMYYGPRREKSPARIKDFDVVISSYSIIAREWPKSDKKNEDLDMDLARRMAGPVFKINWRRVILDEAHFIKNRGTGMAKACYQLDAKYRWCLTGTPLQNNIEELYSLVKFLRIQPFCDWTTFRTQIVQPFKMHNHNLAIGRVQGLMQAICLRRNKKSSLDGQPIILLPPKQMDIVREQFTDPEREFYKALETGIQIRFNKYVRAGTVLKNYTNILVLLLRLRQACCHPSLMGKDLEKMSPEQQLTESAREDRNEALFNALSPDVRRRLEESDLDQECAICMDAMTDAVLNMCGHIFCRECLTASVQHMATVSGAKPCPTCRANVELGDLLSVDFFKQKVNKDAPKDDISSIKGKGSAVMTLQGVEDEILEDLVAQAAHEHSLSSTKIDVLMRTLTKIREETPGEKVIVFSQFTGFLDIIERRLHTKDGRFKCSRYDGRMSATERDEALRQLRTDPQTNIILVSLKCGSLGLNLTCANHVILLDCWWNPAVENQAMDRVHRLGQLKQVTIHRVTIADTIEDRILELQAKKQELFDAAMNEGSGGNLQRQRLSVGDLMMLFNVNNNNNLVRQSSSEAIEIN